MLSKLFFKVADFEDWLSMSSNGTRWLNVEANLVHCTHDAHPFALTCFNSCICTLYILSWTSIVIGRVEKVNIIDWSLSLSSLNCGVIRLHVFHIGIWFSICYWPCIPFGSVKNLFWSPVNLALGSRPQTSVIKY